MGGRRTRWNGTLVLFALVLLVGPARAQRIGEATPQETINVFAAASLTAAFQTIRGAFKLAHPSIKVTFNFAGSSALVQQIEQGAPADVFASADEANMQKLVESGEINGSPQIFARNRLQIAVARGNPKHIVSLADLTQPGLTIALCGPTVPCGRYAGEAFKKVGVSAPAASQEVNVQAVLTKIALGEADAGIVYVTDVRAAGDKVMGVDIPESANVTARYPIAALKHAPNQRGAAAFTQFVQSPAGQHALAEFGFLPR